MRRLDPSLPHRYGQMMHGLDTQPLESFDRTHDVEHRVYRADFVEMHLLGRHPVNAPLGCADQSKRLKGPISDPRRHGRPLDQPQQLTNVATARLLGNGEFDLLTRDAGPPDVSDRNAHITYTKPLR